tara:strand:- start:348 stop:770 length:423 start_codon:yes stop_codon:yes gene_type:complete
VKNKEFSNLYFDLSKEILNKSKIDNNTQLLFLVCIENSLSYLADDIFENFKNHLKPIDHLNYVFKWNELSYVLPLKNIIKRELTSDGLISLIEKSKNILFREDDKNLITSSELNDLKKFNSIINKYKAFKELLRKTLDEC